MVLQNWKRLATIGVVLLTGAVGYGLGYDNASDNAELNRLAMLERYINKQEEIYEKDLEVLMEAQDTAKKAKKLEEEISEDSKNVSTPECGALGDDWLRLYNKSIEAANM